MIDFDSQYSVAWCSLASSAEAAGNLTEAESHYQRAISLYPPARLPRLLYTEYLERHNLATGTTTAHETEEEEETKENDAYGADVVINDAEVAVPEDILAMEAEAEQVKEQQRKI